jgi:hypothetical protein
MGIGPFSSFHLQTKWRDTNPSPKWDLEPTFYFGFVQYRNRESPPIRTAKEDNAVILKAI